MRVPLLATIMIGSLLHDAPVGAADEDARFAPARRSRGVVAAGIDDDVPSSDTPRFTVSGMLGAGGAPVAGSAEMPGAQSAGSPLLAGTLFGGDGAVGIDVPRAWGAVRIECEARGRTASRRAAGPGGTTGTWSAMANIWHDVDITERLAVYAGGGVGPGGCQRTDALGDQRSTGVAWQVGTGVAYDITARMTFDLGYRFGGQEPLTRSATTLPAVGEMVVAVRLHDPLRGWLERGRSPARVTPRRSAPPAPAPAVGTHLTGS